MKAIIVALLLGLGLAVTATIQAHAAEDCATTLFTELGRHGG